VNFAESAAKLAGPTGLLLGWRPDDFWNATPAELATILAAASTEADAVDGQMLNQLMEIFPDG
jgi:uncharacterized phage protein (TIGR02216 family)